MTETRKEFLRKAQFPLLMACAVNPVPLMLYVAFSPVLLPFSWAIPLAYVLLALLSFKIPGKFRLLYGIGGCIVLGGAGAALLLTGAHWISLLVPVVYAVILMMGLPIAGWDPSKEIQPVWYYTGAILHVGVFVFKFIYKAYNGGSYDAIDPGLLVSFFIMVILVMLSLTRINLNGSANGRQKPTAFMWQKNIGLTVIFFVLAALIAVVPALYQALEAFFSWIGDLIQRLFDSIEIEQIVNDMGGEGMGVPPDPAQPAEESLLIKILNVLFHIVWYGVLLALLIPVAIKTWKAIVKLLKKLFTGVSTYVSDASGDYEDEITDLSDTAPKSRGPRFSSAEERGLPPAERIRYRYRRIRSRHPEWERGATARENLPDQAAPLYEKARYSSHPITEEDADTFKANTRRV